MDDYLAENAYQPAAIGKNLAGVHIFWSIFMDFDSKAIQGRECCILLAKVDQWMSKHDLGEHRGWQEQVPDREVAQSICCSRLWLLTEIKSARIVSLILIPTEKHQIRKKIPKSNDIQKAYFENKKYSYHCAWWALTKIKICWFFIVFSAPNMAAEV